MDDKSFDSFIWNSEKELINLLKHNVDFVTATEVFRDPQRKIYADLKHSNEEGRFFCIGKVNDKILTVRFTYREDKIRILVAGYWRKGRNYYEKENG